MPRGSCRGSTRRKGARDSDRERGKGNARGEIVPLTKFTTCVCGGDDDENEDENGDH